MANSNDKLDDHHYKDYSSNSESNSAVTFEFSGRKGRKGKEGGGEFIPWKKYVVPKYVIPFINDLAKRNLKPGTRSISYYLESIRVLPKNHYTYDKVIKAMSSARKGTRLSNGRRGVPIVAMAALTDNSRHIIKDFDDEERSLEDYIEGRIAQLRFLPNGFKTLVPRWLDQPRYVELWTEKKGWDDNLKQICKGRDVIIAGNGGHSSVKFLHDNVERLQDRFDNGDNLHIHILYLGDLDPAGWQMDGLIQKELKLKCGSGVTFKRIGITYEQLINNDNIRHLLNPGPEILKVLSNPNFRAAKPFKQHFGKLFQAELDAIQLIPNFEKLITDEIDALFDKDIYKQVLARPEYSQEPHIIKQQIVVALEEFIEELED